MAIPDSQCYRPMKPVNVEDIVVFLDLKLFNYNILVISFPVVEMRKALF